MPENGTEQPQQQEAPLIPTGIARLRSIPRSFKFLYLPARYKGAHGGRGSGKSHAFAEALIHAALGATEAKPELIGCFREIQNSIKDSVKALLDLKIDEMGVRYLFRSTDDQIIRNDGNARFIFKGMHGQAGINSIKSIEGITKAWVEEAQSVSQPSLDALTPTVRTPGSELWFSWNPALETDPIDVLLRCSNPPPNSIVREVNFEDNPWFPDELRRDMEYDKSRDIDKYLHVWRGQYKRNSEARVFRNWRVEAHEAPPNTFFYQGADWGFSNDPAVLIRCYIIDKRLYIDHEAYKVGCEIDDLPKLFAGKAGAKEEELKAWNSRMDDLWPGIPKAKSTMITADSARPETISFMKRQGFRIGEALKGKGSVEDGIQWLKNYEIIVHPRCKHVIDELSFYSWKTDPKVIDPVTKQPAITNVLEDKNNHTIDSLRYAIEGVRRGVDLWRKLV